MKTAPRSPRALHSLLVTIALILVTVESLMYPSQNDVPSGFFSLLSSNFNIRLLDIAVGVIFVAGLWGHAVNKRAGGYVVALVMSAAYLALMAWVGSSQGVSNSAIFTQSRFVVYLILLLPLALNASGRGLLQCGALALKVMTLPLLLAAVLSMTSVSVGIPGFGASTFGRIGGDVGTVVGILALCAIGTRLLEGKASWAILWFLYPLLGDQRAAMLTTSLVGVVATFVLWGRSGLLRPRARSALRSTVFVLVLAAVIVPSVTVIATGRVPLVQQTLDSVTSTFTSEGKLQSASTREVQIDQAVELFKERPWTGHGLGQGVVFYDVYRDVWTPTDSAHNFVADIAIRGGIIGAVLALVLFLSAFWGDRPWAREKTIWAVALATLLGKALLEPAFDKYRLVFLIALALTAIVASKRQAADLSTDALSEADQQEKSLPTR